MPLSGILIAAAAIALLVVAWSVLQIHNTEQREADRPASTDGAGRPATVVCRRADADAAGDLVRYVTFNIRSEGRREFAIPAGVDDDSLTPGNRGDLFCEGDRFIRFEQDF